MDTNPLLAGLVLVGVCCDAKAADSLYIHIGSEHGHGTTTTVPRSSNPGLGYQWPSHWQIGGYINSIDRPSYYVAYVAPVGYGFSVVMGAATGYWRDVVPLLIPEYRLGPIALHYVPPFRVPEGRVQAAVSLSIVWSLD